MRLFTALAISAIVAIGAGISLTLPAFHHAFVASAATGDFVPPPMPKGAEGQLIAEGKHILQDTHKYAGAYAVANMSCEACHLNAGTKAHGGSLVGVYAKFPQYNKRSKRFIALQDRLAECFLYSENGRPPAYDSREMIALTSYLAYISRGTVVGKGAPDQGFIAVKAPHAPNISAGHKEYDAKCSVCHGASGAGVGPYPPLWGSTSFNNGAGMHRASTMAAFVRYNMPFGSPPNTLSAQESVDVAAYVLSHARATFNPKRTIAFPAQPASFF